MTRIMSCLARSAAVVCGLIPIWMLAGCSTAASMRVEVEVYKGPLSVSLPVQIGELRGVIQEGIQSFKIFLDDAYIAYGQMLCPINKQLVLDCQALDGVIRPTEELLRKTEESFGKMTRGSKYVKNTSELEKLRDVVDEISEYAIRFKARAFFWAEAQISVISSNVVLRRILTNYTTLASEFANQVAARIVVLDKQMPQMQPGRELVQSGRELVQPGRELATSDHLRDASPTAFLHLYDWYNAAFPDADGGTGLSLPDRVRLAQRLFADHYWTKINDVFASGQGEVRMALVKDDIGNWNLKSFDTDPTELLDAYRKVSLASIQAATGLIQNISTGGASGAGQEILKLAGQLAQNRIGSTRVAVASDARIASLRDRALEELRDLQTQRQKTWEVLLGAVQEAKKALQSPQTAANSARTAHTKAEQDVQDKKDAISTVRGQLNTLTSEPEAQQRAQAQLKTLAGELNRLEDTAAETRKAKGKAEADEAQAHTDLNNRQEELRQFATEAVQEARKALEVHRRVIDALKEIETAKSPALTSAPSLTTVRPPGVTPSIRP